MAIYYDLYKEFVLGFWGLEIETYMSVSTVGPSKRGLKLGDCTFALRHYAMICAEFLFWSFEI